MYTEEFQRWLNLNKYLTTPVTIWNKTLTNLYEHSAEHQLDLLGENFSRISEQLKKLSNVKNPQEYLQFQQEMIADNMHATVHNMNVLLRESMIQLEELTKLISALSEQSTNAVKNNVSKSKKEKNPESNNN